ncbi:TonB-dependent receptor [Nguyenibacter vanlangensis]|uniref:TonB-dependent receptor n=2 Tax=Nguyenibacter vanlangensis TaxID=1216886 RepID=A0A7Y7M482_9PROT|nr:TonB-dependent receptor [Nguyenibacter vanlangensis]
MTPRNRKWMLLAFSAFGGTLVTSAFAQTAASQTATSLTSAASVAPAGGTSGAGNAENVVVTGSFLRSSNNTAADPVQIITSRQIQQTSATNLGDYLSRLPSIGSSGTGNTQTNGGDGVSCTDLRNLGQNRVLILIDGKRTAINGQAACVDLNSIPLNEIASIEILKDGGSELYGADAVAGVVNIKLRHDVNTANLMVKGGVSQYGDGLSGLISGTKGFNFDHDRGNITIFGQYNTTQGIRQRDRDWSANPQLSNPVAGPGVTPVYGSSIPPAARVLDASGNLNLVSDQNGTTFHDFTKADRFNFGQYQYLTNQIQNSSLSGDAHYDVDRHLDVYANVRYSHRTSFMQMAASPVTGSIYPSTLPSSFVLPAGNPYNYWGEDVDLYKRMNDLGPRRENNATDTYTVIAGGKGELWYGWNYDASMTYGWNQTTDSYNNMGNYAHLEQELGVQQLDPSDPNSAVVYNPTVCTSQPGCVLQNPFQPYSAAAANYGKFTEHDHAYYQLRDFNLRLNNDKVAKLPYKNGGNLGLAFGMEHRSEQLSYSPDPLVASGQTTGNTSSYTGGGFNVNEVYGEAQLTLLHNAPLARDLTVDAQGRWSSYNTFGSTQNWKSSIVWAPTRDVRFRATLGTSYRQPNVYELYGGSSLGYAAAVDPCAQAGSYGGLSPNVIANCMRQGVNPATFVDANSGQVPTISGGNAKLQPETGRTYTIGAVLTPRWVRGLSVSVDYWHYTLKNMISPLQTQYILDGCYTGANPGYCSDISARTNTGQLTTVTGLDQNLGGLKTSGIDFDLDYRLRLSPMDVLTLSNNFQQIVSYLQQNEPGGAWFNYAGRLFYQGGVGILDGGGIPRVTDYATATWQHGPFALTYMMHYTGGMVWNNGTQDLTAKTAGQWRTPGIFSHDLTLAYRLRNWNFEAGVNNILDKKPPFVFDSASNTNLAQYSTLVVGRYVFLQAGVDF